MVSMKDYLHKLWDLICGLQQCENAGEQKIAGQDNKLKGFSAGESMPN